MMAKMEIWAVSQDEAQRHFWSRQKGEVGSETTTGTSLQLIEIDGEQIRARLTSLIAEFDSLVTAPREGSKLQVDEIELAFVVSASGGVQLITKLEAGAEASIKVKLKRAAT